MSDLYSVMVLFRGGGQVNLTFSSKVAAERAWEDLYRQSPRPPIEDNYGTRVALFPEEGIFNCVIMQDVGRAMEGQVEGSLMQARAQSKAQNRAAHDPMIKGQGQIVQGAPPKGFIGRG